MYIEIVSTFLSAFFSTVSPRVLQLTRWIRAAPPYNFADQQTFGYSQNQTRGDHTQVVAVPPTTVVCVISAEPTPTVSWFREPTNLTLVEGGQFKSTVTQVHAGRYRATLSIEFVRKTDFGSYFCHVSSAILTLIVVSITNEDNIARSDDEAINTTNNFFEYV